MRRTLRELVDAAFAGETFPEDEIETAVGASSITLRYFEAWDVVWWSRFLGIILRELDDATEADVRRAVRDLVGEFRARLQREAEEADEDRRERLRSREHGQTGGRIGGGHRRQRSKRRRKKIGDTRASVARYLNDHDPAFSTLPPDEQKTRVANMMRTLRRTPMKKTRH
jgi:hypothetical protein